MKLDLYIEELVLEGFDPSERYRIGDALEAELRDLLAEGITAETSALKNDVDVDSLDAGLIRLNANPSARWIGGEVAGALYGVLNETLTRDRCEETK